MTGCVLAVAVLGCGAATAFAQQSGGTEGGLMAADEEAQLLTLAVEEGKQRLAEMLADASDAIEKVAKEDWIKDTKSLLEEVRTHPEDRERQKAFIRRLMQKAAALLGPLASATDQDLVAQYKRVVVSYSELVAYCQSVADEGRRRADASEDPWDKEQYSLHADSFARLARYHAEEQDKVTQHSPEEHVKSAMRKIEFLKFFHRNLSRYLALINATPADAVIMQLESFTASVERLNKFLSDYSKALIQAKMHTKPQTDNAQTTDES